MPDASTAVATSDTLWPSVWSTLAVFGSDEREPSVAARPIGAVPSVSSVHAATSLPVALTETRGRSNPAAPALTPTAEPCVASDLMARICAVIVCTAPLPNSCTAWPFAPAA